MGRTAVFTQEQVFEAAEKLAANGQEVTPNALRDLLGRGSFSTFVKHIDAWQQARQSVPVPVVLEMPESVKSAASIFWQAAASEAGKEIAAIREKADAEVKSTKRRLEEAIAAVELLEGEAETDAARLEAIGIELASACSASQQAATESAAREAGLQATADQMRQQIEALQAEVDASLARERVTIEEAATAKAEVKRLIALVGEHSAALTAAKAEIERGGVLLIEAKDKIEASKVRENKLIAEVADAQAVSSRFVAQLQDHKEQSSDVIGKLESERKVLAAELAEARKEYRALAAQYGKASGTVEALKTQVAGQADLIKRLTPSNSKAAVKPKVGPK